MSNNGGTLPDSVREVFQNNLDLSAYECEVYLTLVQNGKCKMTRISELSDVPKHRVYDIAEKLRDRGFVEIVDSYPKEAYAVPPDEVLQPVRDRLDQAEEDLSRTYEPVDHIGGGIAMMKSENTIEKFIQKTIDSASIDVALTLPYTVLESYRDLVADINSDTYVKLVISDIPDRYIIGNTFDLEHMKGLADEVYAIKSHEPVVISANRTQGFFWTGFDTPYQYQEMQGFYVTNQEFSLLFDRYISHSLIPRASDIDRAPGPRSLPARYVRIQDCITDLEQRNSTDLTVSIDGFRTTTRERVQLEGRLVDYYSGEDIVTYLRVIPSDDTTGETVRIGGWKATILDDCEARFITLSD